MHPSIHPSIVPPIDTSMYPSTHPSPMHPRALVTCTGHLFLGGIIPSGFFWS
jgi:hypothetical protein